MLLLLLIFSCNSTEQLEQQLIGEWSLEKVYEAEEDVTERHNPKHNRWIKFNEDGTFVSDGDPFGRNTGRWSVDNKESILRIDSDVEGDNSEWKVSMRNGRTIWTGMGHPRKESTRIIHIKKS